MLYVTVNTFPPNRNKEGQGAGIQVVDKDENVIWDLQVILHKGKLTLWITNPDGTTTDMPMKKASRKLQT